MFLLNISLGITMDQKFPSVTKSYTCKESFPAKSVFFLKNRMTEGKELPSFHN